MARYKVAVIGLGNIGLMYDFDELRSHPASHVWAYEKSQSYELVCGIDNRVSSKEYLNKVSPSAFYFQTIEQAVESGLMNNVDVVSVCTPPDSHLLIIKYLLGRKIGKVIFCEKPIVNNEEEIATLRSLVENSSALIVPNISRRWNKGMRRVTDIINNKELGILEKINVRYTRGIYNTGSHLFDLLYMWTGNRIVQVMALDKTDTSSEPEPSYSFFFKLENDVAGYAEAIDDSNYYLFEIDLYLTNGKIEMRNSGDDVYYYHTKEHHLFGGFKELIGIEHETDILKDACLKNAVDNIALYLNCDKTINCTMEDAIYPLYIAKTLVRSYELGRAERIDYE